MPPTRAKPVTQALIKPKYRMKPEILERLLTLDPTHPEYPLEQGPFEIYYVQQARQPEDYQIKHSYAVALLSDPQDRYPNPRFLAAKFVPKDTDMTPEIQALN